MKKLITMALVGTMLLGLTACGEDKTPAVEEETSDVEIEETVEDEEEVEITDSHYVEEEAEHEFLDDEHYTADGVIIETPIDEVDAEHFVNEEIEENGRIKN